VELTVHRDLDLAQSARERELTLQRDFPIGTRAWHQERQRSGVVEEYGHRDGQRMLQVRFDDGARGLWYAHQCVSADEYVPSMRRTP
jgi:hypothetical protein